MRFITLLLASLSLMVFVGCSGGVEGAGPQDSNNSSTGTDDPTPDDPKDPVEPPVVEPPTPPISTVPGKPGDKVAQSAGSPEATYPAVGSVTSFVRNPLVEPNTDIYAPIIAIVSNPAPYVGQTSGTIQLWAADDVGGIGVKSLQCSIDGGAYGDCTTQVAMTNLSEGNHKIEAIAEDYDGNKSGVVSYVFYVDTTPPTIAITQAPAMVTNNNDSAFTFVAQDAGSGIASYQCRIDSGALANCADEKLYENLADGNHAVYVRATDSVGNKSPVLVHTWIIDTKGPVVQFTNSPAQVSYIENGAPTVRFVAADEISPQGIMNTCTLNGVTVACASAQSITLPNVQGPYTFVVTSVDKLGNSTTASVQWQVLKLTSDKTTLATVDKDRPVDILFVVDNSGSMAYERSNLAERINGMIAKIAGLDWQIAVTSTDSTTNDAKSNGQLIEMIGMPGVHILNSTMNVTTAQTVFGNTVQNFAAGSGNEEGIYSSKRVIDRYIANQAVHRQFIRDGADLSIVVLTDEDEASTGDNVRITPQGFVDFVNTTFNGQKNMVFHSIISRPGDQACLDGEGEYAGDVYDALSRLTGYGEVGGAIIGSVCAPNYTNQLADIGQSVKDMQNSIKLDCSPHDQNNDGTPEVVISYRANSSAAYTVFSATRNFNGDMITFPALLPIGDYKVDYKCRIN